MEAVINGNIFSVRKCFLSICMKEVGYNWKHNSSPLGWDTLILCLLDLLKQAGLYITTLYTVWGLKTDFPKKTVSDTADIL